MKEKKITIVCPSILPVPAVKGGAVETLLENFIKYNSKCGRLELDLITIFDKKSIDLVSKLNNIKVWPIKCSNFQIRLNTILKNCFFKSIPVLYYISIINKIVEIGNKTILVEGGIDCAFEIKKRLKDYNVFYHSHGLEFDSLSINELGLVNSFAGIIFVSDFCLNRALKNGVNKKKCYFLMNRIEETEFFKLISEEEKKEFATRYGINMSCKNIIFKGRIVREKGILELIEAFNKLDNESGIYCLLICGGKNFGNKYFLSSKYEKEIKNKISKNKNIKWLGYISYKEIPIINRIASLAIIPSRWDDPAPLVLIESIISALPTIVSRRGGLVEYSEAAGVEFIDDNRFIESLYEKMKNLLLNEELLVQMEKKSEIMAKKYKFEGYYNELCDYVQKL